MLSIKSKVRQYLAQRFQVPEIPVALAHLASVGFQPKQIFDVGAYRGDFSQSCLNIWPGARIACFEALDSKVIKLKQLAETTSKVDVFQMLLGAESCDRVPLHEAETASSVLVEHLPNSFPVSYHPMRTVDQVVQDTFKGQSPDFLKLDVQGYELEVLKGAEKSLPGMQVILAEVSLLDIHQNVPLVADLIQWLNQRDWVMYDICGLTRRPLDRALRQADMLFVPRQSGLRSDKRWGAD
jgi:FkbM family methyltransferase